MPNLKILAAPYGYPFVDGYPRSDACLCNIGWCFWHLRQHSGLTANDLEMGAQNRFVRFKPIWLEPTKKRNVHRLH